MRLASLAFALPLAVGCARGTQTVDLAEVDVQELRVEAYPTGDDLDITITLARDAAAGGVVGTDDCPALRPETKLVLGEITMDVVSLGGVKDARLKSARLGSACADPVFHLLLRADQRERMRDLSARIADDSAEIAILARDFFVPLTLAARDNATNVTLGSNLVLDLTPATHSVRTDDYSVGLDYDDDAASRSYGEGAARVRATGGTGQLEVHVPTDIPKGRATLSVNSVVEPEVQCSGVARCALQRRIEQDLLLTLE